ncbi:folylpolyglutamate synthase/dihydrofolate synthase family protein [Altererythrobacter sp.]|uniref:bifunctional folylpolyglutamate synthase/dihydrofolate synthase n=1 Tax=Altererythrobacter sp. TaxID=1872480 RepID=UPI001B224E21|nr:folylpolyglutamate synthase/dihydrofolate synthase family protein [Altererythrobacter sp.]MBO6641655.1 bifunctional folylpolyglutamate synthase/dihydrofolate synthase [Altererythrobacter sp.]MBO6707646.1 bifunctional folylpolyglutamate synthase/dihydrofolate synthase [Altererythrobacter sp.]MBO6946222.1 bifunctional folylpolyglutamate synthase/dihydrofolate synthase [Altererythrobacter sp.]
MRDMGRSDDPRVQAQLDRLGGLSIQRDTLGLDAIRELLRRLGDPHKRLPPVFHVAGTNGKGSTCAFLRAMLEAEGYKVHVTTSPHLVRYNERFRVAGKLIEDARLAELLEEVFDAAEGLGCSFFEITIAAAFVEFARVPADACVVEVGLGGRLDATNVLEPDVLAACGIAALGIDHEKFLLAPEDGVPQEPMARIAFEKAGIAKRGVPVVTVAQPKQERQAIETVAKDAGAPVIIASRVDERDLALPGEHQGLNAGLAKAMLHSQSNIAVSDEAIALGLRTASWPARLHRLVDGPLTQGREVWLDGGHNPSAGAILSAHFAGHGVHLIIGMIEGKDPLAIIGLLGDRIRTLQVVPVPNFPSHPVKAFGPQAKAAANIEEALLNLPSDDYPVLIAGSLYLAGEVLRLNDEIPD